MSFSVEVDEAARRIHVRSTGAALGDAQLVELFARIRLRSADVATFDALVDFRSIERVPDVSPESVAALASIEPRAEASELASKRLAVVLGNDEVHAFARSLQHLLRQVRPGLRIFRDVEEATAYIERREFSASRHSSTDPVAAPRTGKELV